MLDLQQFCSTEKFRFNLHKPFSYGGFSYASDGIIAIRVARRDGIPEAEQAKIPQQIDKWFSELEGALFESDMPALPDDEETETKEQCEECHGRGKDHDCPDCECVCENCKGSGEETITESISIDAFGSIFRLKLLRSVLQLPNVEVAVDRVRPLKPMFFRFSGGEGCLMPCSRKLKRHIELDSAHGTPPAHG
jgi:hypothetical protein